jgi:hypothetical protein
MLDSSHCSVFTTVELVTLVKRTLKKRLSLLSLVTEGENKKYHQAYSVLELNAQQYTCLEDTLKYRDLETLVRGAVICGLS